MNPSPPPVVTATLHINPTSFRTRITRSWPGWKDEHEPMEKKTAYTPCRLTWNMSSWRLGRWFSFLNGWFIGSMLIFQGVIFVMFRSFHDIKHKENRVLSKELCWKSPCSTCLLVNFRECPHHSFGKLPWKDPLKNSSKIVIWFLVHGSPAHSERPTRKTSEKWRLKRRSVLFEQWKNPWLVRVYRGLYYPIK